MDGLEIDFQRRSKIMGLDFGRFSRRELMLRGMEVGAGVLAAGALSSCGSLRSGRG